MKCNEKMYYSINNMILFHNILIYLLLRINKSTYEKFSVYIYTYAITSLNQPPNQYPLPRIQRAFVS